MCGGAIISDFVIHCCHCSRLSAFDLWPHSFEEARQSEDYTVIRKSPLIFEEDKWTLPLAKRARTTFECWCSKPNWTQVELESFASYNDDVQVKEENSGLSPNAKSVVPGRTYNENENNWHNLEKRLDSKRKICDINVNFDNNLDCPWPLLETSDEENSDRMSGSDSDSDTYSSPS